MEWGERGVVIIYWVNGIFRCPPRYMGHNYFLTLLTDFGQ
jgi:hypothetical protein